MFQEIGVQEHDGDFRFQTGSGNMAVLCMRSKIRNITHIYGEITEIPAFYSKSGSTNTLVTSNYRPEVEIWPFRA